MGPVSITFCCNLETNGPKVLSKQQYFFGAFIKKLKKFCNKIHKGKINYVFLLKKVGGALIRVGALNRDSTVLYIKQ